MRPFGRPAAEKAARRSSIRGSTSPRTGARAIPPRLRLAIDPSSARSTDAVTDPAMRPASGRISATICSAPTPFETVRLVADGQAAQDAAAAARSNILTAKTMSSGARRQVVWTADLGDPGRVSVAGWIDDGDLGRGRSSLLRPANDRDVAAAGREGPGDQRPDRPATDHQVGHRRCAGWSAAA